MNPIAKEKIESKERMTNAAFSRWVNSIDKPTALELIDYVETCHREIGDLEAQVLRLTGEDEHTIWLQGLGPR